MVSAGRGFSPTHETQFHEWPTRATALRSANRFAIEGIDEKQGGGREEEGREVKESDPNQGGQEVTTWTYVWLTGQTGSR